jgi:hypothetical protein
LLSEVKQKTTKSDTPDTVGVFNSLTGLSDMIIMGVSLVDKTCYVDRRPLHIAFFSIVVIIHVVREMTITFENWKKT